MQAMQGTREEEAARAAADENLAPVKGPRGALSAALERRRLRQAENWRFPTWPRRWPIRWIRRGLQWALILPALRIGYDVRVTGAENIDESIEPYLIISNHNMHLDQGVLLLSMPPGFRQRIAIAAAASDIYGNRVKGFFASLFGNAFPFAKEGAGIREGLEFVVKMLDDGWNVLVFPEGKLTVVGPIQRFRAGVGRLALDTGVPVLPMRITVVKSGFFEGKWLPHPRASVEVAIGPPVRCAPGMSSAEATALLERAVREA